MFRRTFDEINDSLSEISTPLKKLFPFIKKGTFARNLNEELYKNRVAYTHLLRKYVYNPALMNEILTNEFLKEKFFRTFGYQGNLNFTIYPNAWLRDLALTDYDIGENVYMGDGIVLGTNQVSICQTKINVGPIKIGAHTIFDQACKVGLRTKIGNNCVIGISCHIGLANELGDRVKMSPLAAVGHFVKVGNDVSIGHMCAIGSRSVVESESIIPDYTFIPENSVYTKSGKIILKQKQTEITT